MNIATSARSPIPPLDASPPQAYPQQYNYLGKTPSQTIAFSQRSMSFHMWQDFICMTFLMKYPQTSNDENLTAPCTYFTL